MDELADPVDDLRLAALEVADEVPAEGVAVARVLRLQVLGAVLADHVDAGLGQRGHVLERHVLRGRDDGDLGRRSPPGARAGARGSASGDVPDHSLAPGAPGVAAVGEEELGVAGRAEVEPLDRADARPRGARARPPSRGRACRPGRCRRRSAPCTAGDVVADLVAAGADRRPDRCGEPAVPERRHAGLQHPGEEPAPARVQQRERRLLAVRARDGDRAGSRRPSPASRGPARRPRARRRACRARPRARGAPSAPCTWRLNVELPCVGARRGAEQAPVLTTCSGSSSVSQPEVERLERPAAHAAHARGEDHLVGPGRAPAHVRDVHAGAASSSSRARGSSASRVFRLGSSTTSCSSARSARPSSGPVAIAERDQVVAVRRRGRRGGAGCARSLSSSSWKRSAARCSASGDLPLPRRSARLCAAASRASVRAPLGEEAARAQRVDGVEVERVRGDDAADAVDEARRVAQAREARAARLCARPARRAPRRRPRPASGLPRSCSSAASRTGSDSPASAAAWTTSKRCSSSGRCWRSLSCAVADRGLELGQDRREHAGVAGEPQRLRRVVAEQQLRQLPHAVGGEAAADPLRRRRAGPAAPARASARASRVGVEVELGDEPQAADDPERVVAKARRARRAERCGTRGRPCRRAGRAPRRCARRRAIALMVKSRRRMSSSSEIDRSATISKSWRPGPVDARRAAARTRCPRARGRGPRASRG